MKILQFTYTKDEDNVSQRSFLAVMEPYEDYFGYDLRDLSAEEIQALKKFLAWHQEVFDQTIVDFDLTKTIRRFKPNKMSGIIQL